MKKLTKGTKVIYQNETVTLRRDQYTFRNRPVVDVKHLNGDVTMHILLSEVAVPSEIGCGIGSTIQPKPCNKYDRTVKDTDGNSVVVDVYSVLDGFNVTCPALQHLIKKALCVGIRGHKDTDQDLQDINASAIRAIQLNKNRNQGE